jgi:hypothetical protein
MSGRTDDLALTINAPTYFFAKSIPFALVFVDAVNELGMTSVGRQYPSLFNAFIMTLWTMGVVQQMMQIDQAEGV